MAAPTTPKSKSSPSTKPLTQRQKDAMSIFKLIKLDPMYARTRSVDWYKRKIKELGASSPVARTNLMNTNKDIMTFKMLPGTMNFFMYDPKYKEELPYYDMFPLSLVFDIDKTHFTGINFHYLSYALRMKLYEKMYQIGYSTRLPTEQILRLNWGLLSSVSRFPEVRPAVKKYLFSHVKSRFMRIPVDDWATAIMLPVETFAKKRFDYVARDSTRKIFGR